MGRWCLAPLGLLAAVLLVPAAVLPKVEWRISIAWEDQSCDQVCFAAGTNLACTEACWPGTSAGLVEATSACAFAEAGSPQPWHPSKDPETTVCHWDAGAPGVARCPLMPETPEALRAQLKLIRRVCPCINATAALGAAALDCGLGGEPVGSACSDCGGGLCVSGFGGARASLNGVYGCALVAGVGTFSHWAGCPSCGDNGGSVYAVLSGDGAWRFVEANATELVVLAQAAEPATSSTVPSSGVFASDGVEHGVGIVCCSSIEQPVSVYGGGVAVGAEAAHDGDDDGVLPIVVPIVSTAAVALMAVSACALFGVRNGRPSSSRACCAARRGGWGWAAVVGPRGQKAAAEDTAALKHHAQQQPQLHDALRLGAAPSAPDLSSAPAATPLGRGAGRAVPSGSGAGAASTSASTLGAGVGPLPPSPATASSSDAPAAFVPGARLAGGGSPPTSPSGNVRPEAAASRGPGGWRPEASGGRGGPAGAAAVPGGRLPPVAARGPRLPEQPGAGPRAARAPAPACSDGAPRAAAAGRQDGLVSQSSSPDSVAQPPWPPGRREGQGGARSNHARRLRRGRARMAVLLEGMGPVGNRSAA
ncbi:unnamed protein product [Prorocentrum cordatum]|uniref:Cellulase n=1 Tax=Prorocentrum cordatum TaxID=2364126 RepID=A0ABN9WU98_9DINO|nr:unnamed protein product [Polarella glacialis]